MISKEDVNEFIAEAERSIKRAKEFKNKLVEVTNVTYGIYGMREHAAFKRSVYDVAAVCHKINRKER